MRMRLSRITLCAATLVALSGGDGASTDPIAAVQHDIDSGTIHLNFDDSSGYLRSVLEALRIPISSQTLVFSKTSAMREYISPVTPRAIYFTDNAYVALSVGGPVLEIVTVDPVRGPHFYELDQSRESQPKFRQESDCLTCHDPAETGIGRLIMRSHYVDRDGYTLQSKSVENLIFTITDQTPFANRWGGWYVTGTHGSQWHMGNTRLKDGIATIAADPARATATLNRTSLANLQDLQTILDTRPYLTPHSDIVALMVLGHQTYIQNLIAAAAHAARSGGAITSASEALARGMLFADEVPLTEPISGTSSFAADFAWRGPRDSEGRSLRDFDLKRRLFRYPLSYLIYSEAFDALPRTVKSLVYGRLRDALSSNDEAPNSIRMSKIDREAILGILRETKPDFAQDAR
jgi:hypothetical protein